MTRRFRGMGKGRKTRRTLARGGTGQAARINEQLGQWPGVRIAPMFGRWGYFVAEHLFACFPLRPKEHDLWIRLTPADQARALQVERIRPHRRFAARGWVECDVESAGDLSRALAWLRSGYESVRRVASRPPDSGRGSPAPS